MVLSNDLQNNYEFYMDNGDFARSQRPPNLPPVTGPVPVPGTNRTICNVEK